MTQVLAEQGFENVSVLAQGDTLVVWYENRIYRNDLTAMGAVAALVTAEIDASNVLCLLPQHLGVPLLSITAPAAAWRRFLHLGATTAWFRDQLRVRPPTEILASLRQEAPKRTQVSQGNLDFTVRPLLAFELGLANDPFKYSLWLAPEMSISPASGFLFTSQVGIRLQDDLDPFARRAAPTRLSLSWAGWLPGSWLATASGGYFSSNRYGVAVETGHYLSNGALELTLGADVSGLLRFTDGTTLYSSMSRWSAAAGITHRTRGIDLETTLQAVRFLEGRVGGRLDVGRRFNETELHFFGIRSGNDMVAGVSLRLPLPGSRRPQPKKVRLTSALSFPLEYHDSLQNVGLRLRHFNDLRWARKRLDPTYVLNNLDSMRGSLQMEVAP